MVRVTSLTVNKKKREHKNPREVQIMDIKIILYSNEKNSKNINTRIKAKKLDIYENVFLFPFIISLLILLQVIDGTSEV